ncbi:MAG: TlpA family protein disulfide reductase [Archangiaceae bacterium]|nr:TlpA family protein disulfide reductase [Archangiaceae bacterium]
MRPLLAVLLLVANTACAPKSGEAAKPDTSSSTSAATDFSLTSVDGKTVHLSDHLGKDVILLSFWATWCVPCLGEMPKLEQLYQKYRAQGFTVLSISMDGPETLPNVDPTVRRLGVTYPVLLDEETRVVALYNPARDAPFAVLIGKDGRISESRVGYAPGDENQLGERIEKLLAAAP